jgi:hypothetical protein
VHESVCNNSGSWFEGSREIKPRFPTCSERRFPLDRAGGHSTQPPHWGWASAGDPARNTCQHIQGALAIGESALSLALNRHFGPPPGWAIGIQGMFVTRSFAQPWRQPPWATTRAHSKPSRRRAAIRIARRCFSTGLLGARPSRGLPELCRATGDRSRAPLEAGRFIEISLATRGSRYWDGLACEVNSGVALNNRDLRRARCWADSQRPTESRQVTPRICSPTLRSPSDGIPPVEKA